MLKSLIITLATIAYLACAKDTEKPTSVLVFSKTAGFHHNSIPQGIAAIQKIGAENGFTVDTTTDANYFTEEQLNKYAAVIFLSTTGNVLAPAQEFAFQNYIMGGGGFAGVHAATDTEYDWEWYGKMVGGYFNGHPQIQQATLNVIDQTQPSTKDLPKQWTRTDEWYNFRNLNPNIKVLVTIDEKSYSGGKHGDYHPMVWQHRFEGGRVFYTALGHTEASYQEPLFLKHLTGGILYAMGKQL